MLGVEPAANVAEAARAKGIPTRTAFFNADVARQVAAEHGNADLIVANNVLAQVPQLNDFIAGMTYLWAPEGVITIEVPHLERLQAENQFDTIYHEHFSYFSLGTLRQLAAANGLVPIDVDILTTHGGSLRVYLARRGSQHPISTRVGDMSAQELWAGLEKLSAYSDFARRVKRTKRELLSVLIAAKKEGKRICGYGAPGKGNTLLNYCGIGTDFLDFTVDRNPYKHGRHTPGMHVPIEPVDAIDAARPDYILILPWNLKEEIVEQMRHVGNWGAKFIVHIPEIDVLDPGGSQSGHEHLMAVGADLRQHNGARLRPGRAARVLLFCFRCANWPTSSPIPWHMNSRTRLRNSLALTASTRAIGMRFSFPVALTS